MGSKLAAAENCLVFAFGKGFFRSVRVKKISIWVDGKKKWVKRKEKGRKNV